MHVSEIAFACIFGGALLGMLLRLVLPEPHLSSDTKDVVRLSTGLIATLSALVLGLLVASAQAPYQTQSNHIKQITANVVLLDDILARSGPEAQPVRVLLRSGLKTLVDRIWGRANSAASAPAAPFETSAQSDLFYDKLLALTPRNDAERQMQTKAIQLGIELAQTRLLFAQSGIAIPIPLLGHDHLRQLRPLCAAQPHDRGCVIRLRVVGFVCNFFDTRPQPSFLQADYDPKRAFEQRPGAFGSINSDWMRNLWALMTAATRSSS